MERPVACVLFIHGFTSRASEVLVAAAASPEEQSRVRTTEPQINVRYEKSTVRGYEYELWLNASEYSRLAVGFWIGVVAVWVSKYHLRIFVYSQRF